LDNLKNGINEKVRVSINGRDYETLMRRDSAEIYGLKSGHLERLEPIIRESFDALLQDYAYALKRINVPDSLSKRFVGNQKALYEEWIRPMFSNNMSMICETAYRDGIDSGNIESSFDKLAGEISQRINHASENIRDAETFDGVLNCAYSNLRKALDDVFLQYSKR